jgi:hypothetical protein
MGANLISPKATHRRHIIHLKKPASVKKAEITVIIAAFEWIPPCLLWKLLFRTSACRMWIRALSYMGFHASGRAINKKRGVSGGLQRQIKSGR